MKASKAAARGYTENYQSSLFSAYTGGISRRAAKRAAAHALPADVPAAMLSIIFTAILLFCAGCTYEYVNVTDRNGSAYQGYTTVETIGEVMADYPTAGSTVTWCSFTASEVLSETVDLYGLQIAESSDGFETPFYENLAYTEHVMDASEAGLYEGTWHYRVAAHAADGEWGEWSGVVSFIATSGIDSGRISPADNGSTFDTTPLLDWADVNGAASYEAEFADSEAGLDGSDIRAVTVSEYQVSDSEAFTVGETCHWRVRQVNEDGIKGAWSATYGFEIAEPLLDLVFVSGGTFSMGSTTYSDEQPIHDVTVSDFYIGACEVTQGLYEEVIGSNPASGYGIGNTCPVYYVTWYDAVNFCNALSDLEGLALCYTFDGTTVTCDFSQNGYRLPTEAEWEYAARGGNSSNGYIYAGSDTIDDVAWYWYNWGEDNYSTHTVGGKAANELGIYDMSGNVWEWCWDWYDSAYYSESAGATDPEGPASGSYRVGRGGSWIHGAGNCRVAGRDYNSPDISDLYLGFRVVRRP